MTAENPPITETEEAGRYEARAYVGGRLFSKVAYRDPLWGWPYDYKAKAHTEIAQAIVIAQADDQPMTAENPETK